VSGGFALINPDSSMEISAMEAIPVDQLDPTAVSEGLSQAQKRMTTSPTDESEKAEIQIHHEVYQAMSVAISKSAAK
jgi:F-type H+-transporting ATPase subunit delta